MDRSEIKPGMLVSVDEGKWGDESYIPYTVLVLEVPDGGAIKGMVVRYGCGSTFYLGNYDKGDVIWFAPFEAELSVLVE